ncbi:MAG TPA: ribonuclease H-like domain-containing protein [Bacillales bacterium]|nr:ribonuclease H-like domain-containing protein [Bacillales bacterium]
MSLKDKLARHKQDLVSENKATAVPETATDESVKWADFGAVPFHFDGGCCWVRTTSFPITAQHGIYSFGAIKEAVTGWQEADYDHPLSSTGLTSQDLLFFDTETTGLGHGVGNVIFLIGCGRVYENKVEVKQFFLPSPNDEVALYQAFLSDVKELKNLVTYNGKSFDWPQIKTRHTFLRDAVPKLPAFGHFDLLHASRRLWRDTLESSRLSIVEREILQFMRSGDTPGHLVPIYYFEYVKQQNPELIKGVLDHNVYDILSLITLYTHLSNLILGLKPASGKEQYELGRWHAYLGQQNEALSRFSDAADSDERVATSAKAQMARLYKKKQQYEEALTIWRELEEKSPVQSSEIFVEMAKVYEHQHKDFEKALAYAKQARNVEKQRKRLTGISELERDTNKRIERLEKKLDQC